MTTSLPSELIVSILENLSVADIIKCKQLCHYYREIVDGSPNLQYKIELALAGMQDGHTSSCSQSEKREILKSHQHGSHTLKQSMTFAKDAADLLEMPSTSSDGALILLPNPSTTILVQLPSMIRGIPERRWSIDWEFDCRAITADLSQGLVVALEMSDDRTSIRAHFRCVATQQPHPLAKESVLLIHKFSKDLLYWKFTSRITGSYLGVLITPDFDDGDSVFVILDWKTGEIIVNSTTEKIFSFVFLDDRYVLQAVVQGPSPNLRIRGYSRVASEPDLNFGLPILNNNTPRIGVSDVLLNCDPVPSWRPPLDSKPPFSPGASDRVIVLDAFYHSKDFNLQLRFFIPTWVLLSFLDKSKVSHVSTNHIPWAAWSPTNTRVIPGPLLPACSTYGTSYASSSDGFGEIYEFNRFAVRRFMQAPFYEGDVQCEVITEPTVVNFPTIFREPITASVPFLKFKTYLPVDPDSILTLGGDMVTVMDPNISEVRFIYLHAGDATKSDLEPHMD